MKKNVFICLTAVSLFLAACNKIPEECSESWKKMEKLSRQMGLNEEQIKTQKKRFDDEIKNMNKNEAINMCKSQNSLLGVVGQ